VWFKKDLSEKNTPIFVCTINFVDNKRVAGGGILIVVKHFLC
jgi:hypothetical protein